MQSMRDSFTWKLMTAGLLIFGARLWLIQQFGSSVPFWDQWDAVASNLLLKWSEHSLSIGDFFTAHNEHRIPLPRLLSLGLFLLNQEQWQPLLEVTVNAALATLAAIVLSVLLRRVVKTQDNMLLLFVTVLWILPFGWENTLAGFQSAFYFMLLFSFIAVWGLILHKPYQWQWWTGGLLGVLAFFNIASGLLIFLSILSLKVYLLWVDRNQKSLHLPTIFFCIIVLCLEFSLVAHVPDHAVLKAQNFGQFIHAFGNALAFPTVINPLFSPIAFAPFVIFVLHLLCSRRLPTPNELLLLALGIWVMLQAASMAYVRGAAGAYPASRYMDVLVVGVVINLFSGYLLSAILNKKVFYALFSVWLFATLLGLSVLTQEITIPALIDKKANNVAQLRNTQAFLKSNDMNDLNGKNIPYPDPNRLASLLRNPHIAQFLPPSLQGLQLLKNAKTDTAFVLNGFYPTTGQTWTMQSLGSYNQTGNAAQGSFLSESLQFKQAVIELALAGYVGKPGLRLGYWVDGEREPHWLVPETMAGEKWISQHFTNPQKPFKIIAVDESPDYWFAFTMPRGLGTWGIWTEYLLQQAHLIIALGLSLLLIPYALPKKSEAC